jgi:hypothetical protein
VAVYNSISDRRVYIDGGSKGTDATSKALYSTTYFLVGARAGAAPTSHFPGKLAEYAVYDKALSDAEAVSLANGTNKPSDVAAGNLQYYWPLYDDANDDESTNHLTNNNSATFDTGDHPIAYTTFIDMVASGSIEILGTAGMSVSTAVELAVSGVITISGTAGLTLKTAVQGVASDGTRMIVGIGNDELWYEGV